LSIFNIVTSHCSINFVLLLLFCIISIYNNLLIIVFIVNIIDSMHERPQAVDTCALESFYLCSVWYFSAEVM